MHHLKPLRKYHLDRGFVSSDPIGLGWKLRVFENKGSADRHLDVTERRLSQWLPLASVQIHLSPWPSIDLNDHVESDQGRRGFIGLNHVRDGFPPGRMPVFQSLGPGG